MWEEIIIGVLFIAASIFLFRSLYLHFTRKEACKTGCGSCSTIDFEKIEKQINKHQN
jgi:hypothetical protein